LKDSIALEKLVAQIQSRLAPNSKIEHNVELSTLDGKRKRQIDVLVTDRIGQYKFKIAIDCKDHAKKLDVREVGTFNDLIQDVGAHRGVLVCPKGFTRGALARAEQLRIDLYSPIDTDPHKWQIAATAPCIIDYRAASIAIQFSVSSPQRWVINDMNEFFDEMEILRPPINETIFSNWFNGKYPIEAGIHENQTIYEGTTLMKVNPEYEIKAPVHLTADVHVEQRYYFGYTQIKKISGFLNHQTGGVITNAFDLLVDFKEVESSWQMINTIDEAPMKPLFVATGLVAGSLP
jgi:hypothetical protein